MEAIDRCVPLSPAQTLHSGSLRVSTSLHAAVDIAQTAAVATLATTVAPGFEKRLSKWSMLTIYASLAVSLAAGERLTARRRS